MVQKDQELTLQLVQKHNQIIKGNIENFSGNIIKFTDDDFRVYKDAEIDVGEVGLKLKSI